MTRAVAIIHNYSNSAYDGPVVDRQEIVGVLLQKPNESDEAFDKRVHDTKIRLSDITVREQHADADPAALRLATSYLDNKVYSGWLETEAIDILG